MKNTFEKNFYFGCASSGPQSEGDKNKANQNIFDRWYENQPDIFHQSVGPDEASDVYHQFENDVKMMKELNLNSFRTSIQWSRLIQDFKTLEVSKDALAFYHNYIDALIENDIEPFINLYHFDMPAYYQDLGGFENKEVIDAFVAYAKICFSEFGDKVSKWFTMNEPIVPVEGGYLYQFHYPQIVDMKRAVQVGYNSMVASAKVIEQFKKMNIQGEIGIILNLTPSYSRNETVEDNKAAELADLLFNRSFLDPCVHGSYPDELIQFIAEQEIMPEFTEDELSVIKHNTVDLLGVNFYQPRRVKEKESQVTAPMLPESFFDYYEMPGRRMNIYRGWEIYPEAIYDIAINIKHNYNNIKWFVSENGMGVENEQRFLSEDGMIEDDYRIDFIKEHLYHLKRGIDEGSHCIGYHLWTFVDNWSWLNAYKNRYGLVSYNLETKERKFKKSAYFMQSFIKGGTYEDYN
jgi:6-phospho-beta-glucosidase